MRKIADVLLLRVPYLMLKDGVSLYHSRQSNLNGLQPSYIPGKRMLPRWAVLPLQQFSGFFIAGYNAFYRIVT